MITVSHKRKFLKHLLSKHIKTDLTFDFLKEIYNNDELIEKVVFSKDMLTHFKYCISINQDKKHMLIRINKRYNKNERLVKYILRVLKENKDAKLNICIISSKESFNNILSSVCHDTEMVKDLIRDIAIESVVNEVEKKNLIVLINEALDEGDKEKFNELSKKYKELC